MGGASDLVRHSQLDDWLYGGLEVVSAGTQVLLKLQLVLSFFQVLLFSSTANQKVVMVYL